MTDRPPSGPRQNPYVGLVPFAEDDVAWFFGRDRERRIIGANLRSSRLTLLYGASGVGKSSVLQAAVLPGLRAVLARDRAARAAEDPELHTPLRFAVAMFGAWRDAPLEGLMGAIAAAVEDATGEAVAPWSPGTPLRETLAGWLGRVRSLLIVLDQFEEYFLYHPLDDGPGTFAGEFVEVVTNPELRVNFLLSLREDELSKLDRFQGRVPSLFDNYLRVEHLDIGAARDAIEGPIAEYNRRLPAGHAAATIDDEVVDEVLAEVRTRAAVPAGPAGPVPESADEQAGPADRVETPLLQLVMQRLWDAAALDGDGGAPHLRLSTLRERLGGTEKIVHRHLEDALDALSDEDRELAVDVLRPLVSPAQTKIAWRASDLAYWAKRPPARIESILRELSGGQRRILRTVMPPPSQSDQAPRYEIFHDILAAPILEWCAERDEERERRALARAAEEQARARVEAERARRRRRRRLLWRVAGLVLAGLLIAVTLVARRAGSLADSRAIAARAIAQLGVDPERSLLLATQATDEHPTTEAEQALRLSLAASRVRARLGAGKPRPCAACGALATVPDPSVAAVARPLAIAPDGLTIAAIRDARLWLWHPRSGVARAVDGRVGEAAAVVFTPDARQLLVVGAATALMDPDGSHVRRLRGSWDRGAAAAGGRYVVTSGKDGAAVWDVRSGRSVARLAGTTYLSVAFDAAGRVILQNDLSEIVLWRWRSGHTRLLAKSSAAPQLLAEFAPAGGFAVDSATAGKVRVVDEAGRVAVLPAGGAHDPLSAGFISADGSRIATLRGASVELWRSDRPWRAPARRIGEIVHADGVRDVAFSPDSTLVATASTDGTARVSESATGGAVTELLGHTAGAEAVAFSADGRFLATTAEDLTVRLWDLGRERSLRTTTGVQAVAVAAGSTSVAFAQAAGGLRLWTVGASRSRLVQTQPAPDTRGDCQASFPGPVYPTSVAVSADARSLLVGYATVDHALGRAAVVDAASGRIKVALPGNCPVQEVGIDPSGRYVAVVRETAAGTRTELGDLGAGGDAKPVWRRIGSDAQRAGDAVFSPDGRRLVVTSVFGAARIFDLDGRIVRVLGRGTAAEPGPQAFYRAAFSPDGRTIAVAASRDVRLWDARTGDERAFRLSGHTSVVNSVAYDPSGRRIVTAGADGTVRVWDARDGKMLSVIRRHAGAVNDAAFLPNGWIVSGGEDRTVRAYPCETCGSAATLLAKARTQLP